MKASLSAFAAAIALFCFPSGCRQREFNSASIASSVSSFVGLAVNVDLGPGQTAVMAFRYLEEKTPAVLGPEWIVEPYGSHRLGFLLKPKVPQTPDKAQSEALITQLRARLDKIVASEPVYNGQKGTLETFTTLTEKSVTPELSGLSTADPEWHFKFMEVEAAWRILKEKTGRDPGQGVVIGQVDTGLLRHPEIWQGERPVPSILWNQAANFREKNSQGAEDLFTIDGKNPVPSHGTATMSVMVSPRGRQMPGQPNEFVSGVAPAAQVIPVRSNISATLIGPFDFYPIVDGIKYLLDRNVRILVLSFGGRLDLGLQNMIRQATREGVIVFAAGGNHLDFVPWPAAYDETIAVGAGTIECAPWEGSAAGKAIDITAPGSEVWHATAYQRLNGEILYAVRRGVGTSFATPLAAATAALWLSFHGWENLVSRYGKENITKVFRRVLTSNQGNRQCPAIVPGRNGAGFLNARKLLEAPLPEPSSLSLPNFNTNKAGQ